MNVHYLRNILFLAFTSKTFFGKFILLCSPVFTPQMVGGETPLGFVTEKLSVRHWKKMKDFWKILGNSYRNNYLSALRLLGCCRWGRVPVFGQGDWGRGGGRAGNGEGHEIKADLEGKKVNSCFEILRKQIGVLLVSLGRYCCCRGKWWQCILLQWFRCCQSRCNSEMYTQHKFILWGLSLWFFATIYLTQRSTTADCDWNPKTEQNYFYSGLICIWKSRKMTKT